MLLDIKHEIKTWKFTRYKFINLAIGISALLIYELLAKPFYRLYIYSHKIYDFHLADTLGNSLGTIAAVFIPLGLITSGKLAGNQLIKLIIFILIFYEIGQPLLGRAIDIWDIVATFFAGILSYVIYNLTFQNKK